MNQKTAKAMSKPASRTTATASPRASPKISTSGALSRCKRFLGFSAMGGVGGLRLQDGAASLAQPRQIRLAPGFNVAAEDRLRPAGPEGHPFAFRQQEFPAVCRDEFFHGER